MDRPQPHGLSSLVHPTPIMDPTDMDPNTQDLEGWVLRGYSTITDELVVEVPITDHIDWPIADGVDYYVELDEKDPSHP